MSTVVLVTVVGIAAAGVVGWVVDVANSAPDINQLKPRNQGQVSEIFASNGLPLGYIHSDVVRTYVPESEIPLNLRRATVAIEDRRFWQHGGIDPIGILRAAVKDVFSGGGNLQGGSTLTMQLVRNIYLPYSLADSKSLKRKIIEAKLADELESKHTRQWILTQYLNDVPYGTLGGQTAYGVEAASEMFFGKPVWKLNLVQCALLAGLPQEPSGYNPFLDPTLAKQRRAEVLQAMANSHYITQAQADTAAAARLEVKRADPFTLKREPYIFDYVRQQLIQRFGLQTVENGGLKVYTTIDLQRQQWAREALLANEGQPGDPAAALVSIDPTNGHILAMATTSTYGSGPGQTTFDYAWQGRRQTGSAFKVFSLMTLIHDFDGDPNQTYYNSHELQPGWLPGYPTYHVQTAEHSYLGTVSVTKATTLSDNTVFAQLAQDLGITNVTATAHAMGITSPLTNYPSEALGAVAVSPLEMADAYATLASGGIHHPPTAITKVVFPDGRVVNFGDTAGNRVFSYGETYAADQVLKTVITSGTGTEANYGCPAAGKTGTTSNYTDAYFDGYTPQLTTAVWVGYPNSTESMTDVNGLGPGFGGTLAAPIWRDYMEKASEGYCSDFSVPTTPWTGVPYFGHFAVTGGKNATGTTTTGTGTTTTGANGTTGGVSPNAYTNPTLFAQPPQPSSNTGGGTTKSGNNGNGNGNGNGAPPGFGTGHGGGGSGSGGGSVGGGGHSKGH